MRARLLLATTLLLLGLSPALAGPWPRPQGETYVFVGHEGNGDGWTSLYFETGLPRDLTFGLDTGGHVAPLALGGPDDPVDGRVRVFLRAPVFSSPEARARRPGWMEPWLLAVEIGAGPDIEEDGAMPLRFAAGLTLGRPLETRLGAGWTTVDLRATLGGARPVRLNAAYVVGVKPTDRVTLELGLFAEREVDDLFTAFAPTMEYKLGEIGAARLGVTFKNTGERLLRLGWTRQF
ncbi:hypothetical protein [Jannaschia seohaensis]|uniref:Uncharacterized protein n=1 Tax=Jannaschia seohaensis TaxID=475081 RepID=A0A2Y9AVT6_9RHOB|nr:hypothetical protein [Jannaschia seohaensis]PWJ17395.1 hypothetical protein BCF38_1065 [Jannaschia seohaensis]SSA47458.1 hypothetical protein SAMN05421539_1065 [Jannaschia seohaensis]